MGERAGKALEAQYGLYQDDEVASRIDRIGKALAAHSTRQIPYTFKVLNTQDVNALACPGGFIYVYKGLVDTMTSDDELAAVLGHEIGHIESAIPSIRLKTDGPVPSYHPCWRGQRGSWRRTGPCFHGQFGPHGKLQSGR